MSATANAPRRRNPSGKTALVREFVAAREELVGTLAAMLGNADDAQDVAQETFLKCWVGDQSDERVRNWRAWLFRVGLNAAKDLQRNAFRRKARPLEEAPLLTSLDTAGPPAAYARVEDQERIQFALRELRRSEQEVFLLRHNGLLTYDEIAERCGRPVGTIKTQMRSAVGKLRAVLQRK